MNITILSLRGPTRKGIRGGAREYIEEISKGLVKNGHDVNIICGAEPSKDLYESEIIDGVNIIRVGKTRWSIFSIIKHYIQNLRDKTDVLIENMVSFPMYVPLFKGKKKNYTIVHHLTGKEYFKTHGRLIALLGYFMESVTLRVFYRNSNFIAVSNFTKNALTLNGINNRKIYIVNPGIRENYFFQAEKSKNPTIFFLGRYSGTGGNKKVDHLIEAFRQVQIKIPNAELFIGGKGDNIDILKEKAAGYNIEFLGLLTDEEKRSYMQKSWIFASPSLAEGFGITWIEANACGTPVVAYKINGLDTVNESCSIMVEKNNINELANAIVKLCEGKNKILSMQNQCIKNADKYTWSSSVDKFIKILNKK